MTNRKPWNIKKGVYEVHLSHISSQTLAEMRKKGLETPAGKE